eukprot:CAMPEP_0169205918 /NCGR_PEP_ID=MMETSP1016-20121227/12767_1 /TAXON_ID=342587 /ORGANISM="Karlodinium micrum, Strain CCMP2283" /LENGTH=82 /DNA_ID=CAMNT_0009283083 /DNA_START=599 /DNA_END=843 /DNA_ORIENTATION=-
MHEPSASELQTNGHILWRTSSKPIAADGDCSMMKVNLAVIRTKSPTFGRLSHSTVVSQQSHQYARPTPSEDSLRHMRALRQP